MSHFSHSLSCVISAYGGNSALERACGVHNAVISRLAKGVNEPDRATIQKFCNRLPDEAASSLVISWLRDILPPSGQGLVKIEETTSPGPALHSEAILDALDFQTRSAIVQLAKESLSDQEFARHIYEHTRRLFPEWAKLHDQEITAAIIRSQGEPEFLKAAEKPSQQTCLPPTTPKKYLKAKPRRK